MLRIGCCGFTMAQDDYFAAFESIEIQKTFYQPPLPRTAEKWRRKAGDDFVFTAKAWQPITHYPSSPTYRRANIDDEDKQQCGGFRSTDMVMDAWRRTRQIADILRAPLVVFQCPASFEPTGEHKDNMRRFFGEIERGDLLLGWEPRGDWKPDTISALCRELDLVHVVDPFKDRQLHGDINYFRLHGKTGYRYNYTPEDLEQLRGMLDREKAFCMFNNISMADDARAFARMMGGDAAGEDSDG